jgi:nucleoside-diphosphate-sugar epimerase
VNKYLVLGSSGFLGKNLTSYLRSKSHNVIEFDINNVSDEDLRIYDNTKLRDAISSCDFVFFLAFDVGGSKYLKTCSKNFSFLSNNTKILSNTFSIINEFNRKFIFISSYLTNDLHHSYGLLKYLGEQFTHSLNGLVVRLYNIFGHEDISIRSHVIPDMINQAIKSKMIILNTNGEEKRQFLHVDDCCEGLYIASMNYYKILSECNVFDMTSYEWTSIKNVAKIICSKSNSTLVLSSGKAIFNYENSPNKYFLKYWKPQISLEDGISRMLVEIK